MEPQSMVEETEAMTEVVSGARIHGMAYAYDRSCVGGLQSF